MRRGSLMGYALTFVAGFGFGFMYHHIASMAHSAMSPEFDGLDRRMHSYEARLLALEATGSRAAGRADIPAGSVAGASLAVESGDSDGKADSAAGGSSETGAVAGAAAGGSRRAARKKSRKLRHDCPPGRKPYHVVLTAQDSTYQAWQTRLMYYHFTKLQRSDPCTEMTGFTRLLSSADGRHDELSKTIPTVTAKMLRPGDGCRHDAENSCDMGFPVMNRPHAVTQFLAHPPESLVEDYVLIAETDHLFMREPKNRATPNKPVCFPFGYMNAKAAELRPVVAKWVDNPDVVDPCGPSPTLIHLPLLRRLTPEWLKLSFELKRDATADKAFGWVLEMWGYTLASARLGVRHFVWDSFQAEPSALWHTQLEGDPHIYHYTFGLEYTSDGLPVTSIGDWSLDKRHYMASFPPKRLNPPPRCAGKAAATLVRLFNDASSAIDDWPAAAAKGTLGWGESAASMGGVGLLTDETYASSALARAVVGRGAWQWEGKSPLVFYRGGRVSTPWGSGGWNVAPRAGGRGGGGADDEEVHIALGKCGGWTLRFSATTRSFTATQKGSVDTSYGALAAPHANDKGVPDSPPDGWSAESAEAPIAKRLLGSGPWAWTGVAPLAFLPEGRLHTPWGRGTWRPHESLPSTVRADFVGQKHVVTFDECWGFTSVRESDGDEAKGGAMIEPPAASCPELTDTDQDPSA